MVCGLVGAAYAQPANPVVPTTVVEGRPAASVPAGPGVNLIAPNGAGVLLYEVQRIKRTPPLDPSAGLEGNWDKLYSAQEGTGIKTGYFNWDDNYLYMAVETPTQTAVRWEMDLKDDGWLRGADNIVIQVPPAGGAVTDFLAYRFDTVQNKDQPVWALCPIPASMIKVMAGRTPNGNYAVTIALPRTEDMGLERKAGSTFGLRFETGDLPDPSSETTTLALKPMLRLLLADDIPARTPTGLSLRVSLDAKDNAPGENIRATLEIRNDTKTALRVGQMFLKGWQNNGPRVDSSTYASADIPPGKSIKRELKSSVAPGTPLGTLVVAGGFEAEGGGTFTALTTFQRVEPYQLTLETEERPVSGNSETQQGDVRSAKVVVKSMASDRVKAKITVAFPENWKLTSGKETEEKALTFKGDVQGVVYKFLIPPKTMPGEYPISVTVDIGGKTYRKTDIFYVIP